MDAQLPAGIFSANHNEDTESECGCPNCGERRFDFLEWSEDSTLTCGSCSTVFDPNAMERND